MYHYSEEASLKDDTRQEKLESLGVKFIRFSEHEIKYDMQNVLRSIENKIIDLIKNDPSVKLPVGFDVSILNS